MKTAIVVLLMLAVAAATAGEGPGAPPPVGGATSRDPARDVSQYRQAAEQGFSPAQYELGIAYEYGQAGVSRDYAQATQWYLKAAGQGYPAAQYRLGMACEYGQLGLVRDHAQAAQWFRQAAAPSPLAAFPPAQYALGMAHEVPALRWYRGAAETGSAPAQYELQYELGMAYEHGLGGVSSDRSEAARWYRKSAEQGFAPAQTALGSLYDSGQGVREDWSQAVQWYRKAAEQGFAPAQSAMAWAYRQGRGVQRDSSQAAQWSQKVAENRAENFKRTSIWSATGNPKGASLKFLKSDGMDSSTFRFRASGLPRDQQYFLLAWHPYQDAPSLIGSVYIKSDGQLWCSHLDGGNTPGMTKDWPAYETFTAHRGDEFRYLLISTQDANLHVYARAVPFPEKK